MKKNTYLKFLHLAQAIQKLPSFPELDSVEERLLNIFADNWYQQLQVNLTDMAKIIPNVSERTFYRRVKGLVDKNMVTVVTNEADKRVKYIRPTPLCEKYFKQLDECLSIASDNEQG